MSRGVAEESGQLLGLVRRAACFYEEKLYQLRKVKYSNRKLSRKMVCFLGATIKLASCLLAS